MHQASKLELVEAKHKENETAVKTLLILNPNAGSKNNNNDIERVLQILGDSGSFVTIYYTQDVGDLSEVVKEYSSEFDFILAAGGDGTLRELAIGIEASDGDAEYGYLPSGTSMDVAKSLGISTKLPEAALQAKYGETREFDLGQFNDDKFAYIASFGAFTEVSYDTDSSMKSDYGFLAYIMKGIGSIRNIKKISLKAKIDDEELEGEFAFGAITNTKYAASGIIEIKDESFSYDDGQFEVLLIKSPSKIGDGLAISDGLMNKNYSSDIFYFKKASKISLEFTEDVDWTLDGDYGGASKTAEISVIPKGWKLKY